MATKRYESTVKANTLQINQADRLAQGWSLLNDDHIVSAILWLMSIASTSSTLTALVQLSGWHPLLVMVLFVVLAIAITLIVIRRKHSYQRFFLVGAIVVGFVFAVCWQDLFLILMEAIDR
jgi:hypothetical protein